MFNLLNSEMIHQRYGIILFTFFAILFSCTPKKPMNVVFILVDDLGWTDLGSYGSKFYETKNLDKLAEQSVKFSQAYAASPVCSPTRAAILTGKYPSRVNITDWIPGANSKNRKLITPEDGTELQLEEAIFPEILKQNGYTTFFAGKWHLGSEGYFPEDQGFDYNYGGHHKGSPPGGYYSPYKNPKLEDGPDGEYLTDRLTNESIHFIEKNKNNPFLLYLSYYTVHTPIQAAKKYHKYYKAKAKKLGIDSALVEDERAGITVQNQYNPAYASMVHAMDENVGRVINKLEEAGLIENTLIVFTSDNGGLSTLYKRPAPTSVKPLRAGKGWCYEGGIRIPLIIKTPGKKPNIIDNPVISMDLFPTIIDILNLKNEAKNDIDGMSLLPMLNEKEQAERTLFWHYPHYHGSAWTPGAAIRVGDWKLIEFYEEGVSELYNIEEDIGEKNNLIEKYPEKADELKNRLKELQAKNNAQLPIVNANYIANP